MLILEKYWPILLTIASSILYHFCQKTTKLTIHPAILFAAVYFISFLISVLWCFQVPNIPHELLKLRGQIGMLSLFSLSIIGIEVGLLLAYRYGSHLNNTAAIVQSGVIVSLFIIGSILFKEAVNLRKILGIILILCGLFTIMSHRFF